MRLQAAYSRAKEYNQNIRKINKTPRLAYRIVKKNYSGFKVEAIPIDLEIIKSRLNSIVINRKKFIDRVKIKYKKRYE